MKPKAIRFIRSDGMAEVCAWHPDFREAKEYCELNNLGLTGGICPDCLVKFKADSLKNSNLALKH